MFFISIMVYFEPAEEKNMNSTRSIFTAHMYNEQQHMFGNKQRKIPHLG
jgi:hypothetical protein